MKTPPFARLALPALMALVAADSYAQSPELRVDLDQAGRQEAEVNQPGYLPWVIPQGQSATRDFDGVTVTFTREGPHGSQLRTNWYSAGIANARLVSDGVGVDGGNDGAQIKMTLSGLSAGEHTLLVYLNAVDNPANRTFSPIDVFVNGTLVLDDVIPSERAPTNGEAQSVYLYLTSDGSDIEVLFAAETGTDATQKNVMINGFELNTPNAALQAFNPIPGDVDEHVDADNGSFTLEWTPAPNAIFHEVYFGTDREAVASGDSSVFQGRQATTGFDVDALYSRNMYYWRVDQVGDDGRLTRGNVWSFRPRQLAFPGAEGYGRFAIGGRGGQVVRVTNLNDSGPGSLREAITNDVGPRTIVFDVGGIITLESRLTINQSHITIAGQTAPGKGIVVRGAPLGMSGVSDVVIQHMRVRLGAGTTFDGMGMQGSDHSIIDRSSISWTIDEAFSSRSARNITLQRTLIAEALNDADHANYVGTGRTHGFAASISGDIGSFHHNLLAHNDGRNWSLAGGLDRNGFYAGRLDIFNNVVYNWRNRTTDGGAHEVNFVNNYYKPGPATVQFYALNVEYDSFPGTQRYYCAGNIVEGHANADQPNLACRVLSGSPQGYSTWVPQPFFPSYATIDSAAQAYKRVLSDVGASRPVQDDQDIRVIQETLEGTYSAVGSRTGYLGLPDHQDDVGGYEDYPEVYRSADWDTDGDGLPDWWERLFGLNPNSASGDLSDAHLDVNGDGYTELDYYLQWMSELNYMTAVDESVAVNLEVTFRGYESAPVYSVTNVINGTVVLEGDQAIFTPSECGLASFELNVTDSAGDTMTRQVGVFVDAQESGACVGDPHEEKPRSRSSGSFNWLWLLALLGVAGGRAQRARR